MQNKIISIIPARYNSTRFKAKLLYKVSNKSILQHTFESVKKVNILDDIFIATEDEIIKEECSNFNANCIMTSQKPKNGTERIIEALKNNLELLDSDIIVNVQADHPLINEDTINDTVNILLTDPTAHVSTAVTKIDYETAKSENVVKCVFDKNFNAMYFSRSLIPYSKNFINESYFYHIGIYCYRTKFLLKLNELEILENQKKEDLEQLKILENGFKIKVALVNDIPQGVDVFEDLKKVEKILCK